MFTVVGRQAKYESKVVVDTVLQRLGDSLGAAAFQVGAVEPPAVCVGGGGSLKACSEQQVVCRTREQLLTCGQSLTCEPQLTARVPTCRCLTPSCTWASREWRVQRLPSQLCGWRWQRRWGGGSLPCRRQCCPTAGSDLGTGSMATRTPEGRGVMTRPEGRGVTQRSV